MRNQVDVEIGSAATAIEVLYIFPNQSSAPMKDTVAEMDNVTR